jgi:hypothetical protein
MSQVEGRPTIYLSLGNDRAAIDVRDEMDQMPSALRTRPPGALSALVDIT